MLNFLPHIGPVQPPLAEMPVVGVSILIGGVARGGGVLAGTMMMAAIHNRIAAVVRHRRLRADRARFLRQRALLEAFLQARTSAGGASNTSMVQQISSIIVNGGENLSVPDAMARMAGAYLADADDSNAMRVIELGLQIEPRHTHLRRLRASAQAVAAAKRATEEANSCGIQEGVPPPRRFKLRNIDRWRRVGAAAGLVPAQHAMASVV